MGVLDVLFGWYFLPLNEAIEEWLLQVVGMFHALLEIFDKRVGVRIVCHIEPPRGRAEHRSRSVGLALRRELS